MLVHIQKKNKIIDNVGLVSLNDPHTNEENQEKKYRIQNCLDNHGSETDHPKLISFLLLNTQFVAKDLCANYSPTEIMIQKINLMWHQGYWQKYLQIGWHQLYQIQCTIKKVNMFQIQIDFKIANQQLHLHVKIKLVRIM